jgi:RHS repeat-associated protein
MKSLTVQPLSKLMFKHRFWSFLLAALLLCASLTAYATDNPSTEPPPPLPEKPDDSDDPDKQPDDPFYLHSGEYYYTRSFLRQAGEMNLEFAVRYSSFFDFHSAIGYAWTHNYNERLYRTDDGNMALRSALGTITEFEPIPGQPGKFQARQAQRPRMPMTVVAPSMRVSRVGNAAMMDCAPVIADNSRFRRQALGGAAFSSQVREDQILTVNGDGTAVLVTRSQISHYFDAQGRLTKIANGRGAELRMTYDPAGLLAISGLPKKTNRTTKMVVARDYRLTRVDEFIGSTATGNSLEYSYDADGHISGVTAPNNRQISLTYNTTVGDLTKVTDVGSVETSFTYWPTTRLLKTYATPLSNDGILCTNTYDTNNRLSQWVQGPSGEGAALTVSYSTNYTEVSHTIKNAAGTTTGTRKERTYFVVDVFGKKQISKKVIMRGAAWDDASSEQDDWIITTSYDAATGRVTGRTLANGSTVSFLYDANGNVSKETRLISTSGGGINQVTDYSYDAQNNVTKLVLYRTDRPTEKFITVWTYDASNRILSEKNVLNPTDPEASWTFASKSFTYDAAGRKITVTTTRGTTFGYEYNDAAHPDRVTREYDQAIPTNQTTYTYGANGFDHTQTDALGRITTFEFDSQGRPKRHINALGEELINTYTGPNLTEIESGKTVTAPGRIGRYVHDALNRVTTLKRINDAGAEVTAATTTYDNEGRTLSKANPLGQTISYEYDNLGWLKKIKQPFVASTADIQYTTDRAGRITSTFDTLNVETRTEYDLLDQVIKRTEAFGTPDARITEYTHNALSKLVQVKRTQGANVFITTYGYDGVGRNITASGARRSSTTYAYNAAGDLISTTDARGNTTTYTYNAYGALTTTTFADDATFVGGNAETRFYDAVGNLTKLVDGRGTQHFYHHDSVNRLTETSVPVVKNGSIAANWWTDPALVIQKVSYNAWGEVTSTSDIQGGTTSSTYDRFGRMTQHTFSTGLILTYGYNALDQLVSTTYPKVNPTDPTTVTTTTYNPINSALVDSVTDRAGNTTLFTYNKRFQCLTVTTSLGATTTNGYDNLGRTITVTNHLGDQTKTKYDLFNQPVETTFPDHVAGTNERIRTRTYGNLGELLAESGAGGYDLTYTYDAVGNLVTLTDSKTAANGGPGAGTTTWEYDTRNRIKKKIYPDGKFYTYTYDEVGNAATRMDGKGAVVNYSHNLFNQTDGINYPTDTDVTFTYDSAARMTGMVDGSGTSTWTYDTAGRVLTYGHSRTGRTLTYTYAPEAGLISRDLRATGAPTGVLTTHGYDASGRLKTILDPEVSPTPFTYTWKANASLVQELTYPNQAKTTRTYDVLGRLTGLNSVDGAPTPVAINGWSFTYTKTGQRKDETRTSDGWKKLFGYDADYQLVSANRQDSGQQPDATFQFSYNFDEIGNFKNLTAPAGSRQFSVNQSNQYTIVDAVSLAHDDNGSLTSDGSRTYVYDEENRLVSTAYTATPTAKSEFIYDGLGRVIERKVTDAGGNSVYTRYVLDGGLPVQELDETNAVTRTLTRGLDVLQGLQRGGGIGGLLALTQGGASHYFFSDSNGNVTDLVKASDNSRTAHYEYDPFGQKLVTQGSLSNQPYQWASKPVELQSELIDFGFRFYSTRLARWTTRDPIEEAGGVNLYGYALNDPINAIDAFGCLNIAPLPVVEVEVVVAPVVAPVVAEGATLSTAAVGGIVAVSVVAVAASGYGGYKAGQWIDNNVPAVRNGSTDLFYKIFFNPDGEHPWPPPQPQAQPQAQPSPNNNNAGGGGGGGGGGIGPRAPQETDRPTPPPPPPAPQSCPPEPPTPPQEPPKPTPEPELYPGTVVGPAPGAVGPTQTTPIAEPLPPEPSTDGAGALKGPPNWKSTKEFGHTFLRHGQGEATDLVGRARGTGTPQGYWTNNQQAAELISGFSGITSPIITTLPVGLGRVILSDGTTVEATHAVIVPRPGGGFETAYPILP